MTKVAAQLAELDAMDAAALAARYADLFGRPPRLKKAAWLRRKVGWKLQERAYGGLSPEARAVLDRLIAEVGGPLGATQTAPLPKPRRPDLPPAGSTLVRRWHGVDYTVRVLERGFEHDGRTFRSLSAVAQAITGQRWNPKLFFGLAPRRRKP